MRASSNFTWSTVTSRQLANHPDLPLPVLLCRVRNARRMRLRLDERGPTLKITHPWSVRPAAALAWAVSQKSWIEGQLERCLPPQPFVPGAVIPLEGENVRLCWSEDWPRSPRLADAGLCCGGPLAGFSARIERFLKRRALETLSRETEEIAGKVALSVAAVSIGDARTRWGSCSSTGRIRYSWRLILAPPAARRYVVAHEVAHLKHLDHGPVFRALERELFGGDVAAANSILRIDGLRLRRIGLVR